MTPSPREQAETADDLHLIVLLWQEQRTRDVALALADRNRINAKERK